MHIDGVLLDSRRSATHHQTAGTGVTHDWSISEAVVRAFPDLHVVLAGGLRPQNLTEAISVVRPYAVDTMTGAESAKGIKDYPPYLIAITGFERACNDIRKAFPDIRIFTADRRLTERDRAFSPKNKLFQSDRQRKCARETCERFGNELLKERYPDPKERELHVLGYKRAQALVVFEHNPPNLLYRFFGRMGATMANRGTRGGSERIELGKKTDIGPILRRLR